MKNPILSFTMHPFLLRIFLLLLTATALHAQVPTLLNYQGRVAVDAVNFEGAGLFKFALVNEDGSVTFWSNDGSSVAGSEPADAVPLTVAKGLYSLLLGDVALANMTAIPASVFTNPDVRLRVWFDDGVNGSQLLTPDQRIAPAPYLADGAVTSAAITPGAITGTHVAPGSLDFSHLTVLAAPSAGQVLGFDGVSMNWVAPGGVVGGDSVFSLNGTSAYYNGGRVGIGTSAPPVKLTVQTPSGLFSINNFYGIEHTDGAVRLTTYIDGNSGQFGTRSNHPLSFFVNDGAPSMTISSAGNVGIGRTPASKLHVYDTVSVTHLIESGGGTNAWSRVSFKNTNGQWNVGTSRGFNGDQLYFQREGTPGNQFQIQPNGDASLLGTFSCKILTIRGGADLAEPFAMSHSGVAPGTVVVIDAENPGKLRKSTTAYDRKVAGIVSGANGIHAGISMIDEQQLEAGENVALSGRVFVKANTSGGAIAPGDLLTTSDIAGEAMKAADHDRAQGSILGKAMTALEETTGLVLVLVTLQ